MSDKRSRDEAAEPVAAEAPAGGKGEAKRKRRKKGKAVDESTLDPLERARRERQRKFREIALRVRGEGAEYKQRKAKAKVWKDVNHGVVVPRPSQRYEAPEPKCHKPQADFQVAILPIFWNFKDKEKQMVIAQCVKAAKLLEAEGISTYVDESSHSTPGQKMRHWEEKGVKVRLEVGPKDAEQSICTVARSQERAGEVAHKVAGVEVGHKTLLPVVTQLLKMHDSDVPEGDWSKYEKQKAARAAGVAPSVAAAGKAKAPAAATAGADSEADSDAEADAASDDGDGDAEDGVKAAAASESEADDEPVAAVGPAKAVQRGDDLEDDFAIETEDVSEALTNADRRRLLKKKKKGGLFKNGPVSDEAGEAVAAPAPVEEKKPRKPKVVKF